MSVCFISFGSEDGWCDLGCKSSKHTLCHQADRRVCVVVAVCLEHCVYTSTVIMHHGEHVAVGVEHGFAHLFVVMRRGGRAQLRR